MKTAINILWFSILTIVFANCVSTQHIPQEKEPYYLSKYCRDSILYDTIDGYFYYENLIAAYTITDVIEKNGEFIKVQNDIAASYYNGYYALNLYYLQKISKEVKGFRYDSLSVRSFLTEQRQKSIVNGTYLGETPINPYCGVYYKRYHLKIEVAYLGKINQIIPEFKSCKEAQLSPKKKSKHAKLPTYLITKIFEATEG